MNKTHIKKYTSFIVSIFILCVFFFSPIITKADALLPGNISTCGELAIAGTYIITQNITGSSDTCFIVSSDNVTIEGGGFTISTSVGTIAINGQGLVLGQNGYTNLIINDLNITGYVTGIKLSGADDVDNNGSGVNSGYGGDGGDVAIYYSHIGSIISSGGQSDIKQFGGLGGNVSITDTDLDISNSSFELLGGLGYDGGNTNGGLVVNYTGTFNKSNVILSAVSYLNENLNSFGIYTGGSWPIAPGNVSSCGALLGSGTYTLTQNITDVTGRCFEIKSNNIIFNGNGYSITATSSNSEYAFYEPNEFTYTVASTTVYGFENFIYGYNVTISGHNLDLSNKYIGVSNLTINYTGTLNKIGAMAGYMDNLTVNSMTQGSNYAPGPLLGWVVRSSYDFRSIATSADGKKLAAVADGGRIYTSTDSGVTWTARESNRYWQSITSSADGTKLAAVVQGGGKIYTSTDSGVTWTARDSDRNWYYITSSADGTKLAAVENGGQIYTSTDSGVTWVARESSRGWYSITSSADGTKLAAVAYNNGQIYTSTDSGVTWTARQSSRQWRSITSSSDGTKLAAIVEYGQIYTSNDSGVTWTPRGSNRYWRSITSNSARDKLTAVGSNTKIYKSIDSGVTWTEEDASRGWNVVVSSSDGSKLFALANGQVLYREDLSSTLSVDILSPSGDNLYSWNPIVSWGSATSCYYSYDNFVSTSTANCASLGSDISNPGLGSKILYVKGIDVNGVVVQKNTSFNLQLPITITAPTTGSTVTSWNPVINWDPNNRGDITNCYYSYNNFVSTSTASCSGTGVDILPPSTTGASTLYLKVVNSNGFTGGNGVTFLYSKTIAWTPRESNRNWISITSSADGTKLAAVENGGQIYTSTDSGVTWTARNSNRGWYGVTSSADGTKLAAVVLGGQIYTSTDSGVTWTARGSNRSWNSITSSSDGTKLAADTQGGQIYTSIDSGVTWTARESSRQWRGITSSANGTKLAAVEYGGQIYTSTDSGVTWTARESNRNWLGITSSSDGTKLAATVYAGQIYTSTDSGVTWIARESNGSWRDITSSADGNKLSVSTTAGGKIYTSVDSGVTWVVQETIGGDWWSITSSADGNKIAGVVFAGQIYTYDSNPSVTLIRPTTSSSVLARAWSSLVNWGASVSCYYSYDNFVSTSTANCASLGNDIARPLVRGANTLYVKGVDALNAVSNQFVSFDFDSFVWKVRELNRSWYSITSSADGTKLAAVVNGGDIYISTDSGATWFYRSTGSIRGWQGISMSNDGTKLVAVAAYNQIYISSDSGLNWIPTGSASPWSSVTSSADGTKLAATVENGRIYTSTNSGVTWTGRDSSRTWYSITSSADGTKLAAVVVGGQIYTSTDSGATWIARDSNRAWYSITSSSDGTKLAAVVVGGLIYTSNDSGVTWTPRGSSRSWKSITSSADGTKLAAVVGGGQIYISTDSGVTWTPFESSRNWVSITSSADGTKLAAVVNGGQIYTISLTPNISNIKASSTISSWSPIVEWSNALTCEYSYNNSTWSGASCNNAGSDIPQPASSGPTTLYLKGTDFQNVVSTSSVSFTYLSALSTSINACGIISTPGTYTLTQNIIGVTDTCFIISANDVTINGSGFTVTAAGGNTSYAVTTGTYTNLTLDNITFSGFAGGTVNSPDSSKQITYSGTDVNLSNSTTTFNTNGNIVISYINNLTTLNTYFSSLFSLIINNVNLGQFAGGMFSWNQENISSCQTISAPGYYKLTQNITGITGTCFDIDSDKVIIDGNGHTISSTGGNTSYAFVISQPAVYSEPKNIGIKNLTVTGFAGTVDAHGDNGFSGSGIDNAGSFGSNVSLENVNFPTNTVSVNTSGGDSIFESLINGINIGANAGNIKVINSTIGSVIMNGGDANGDLNIGYSLGIFSGGFKGIFTNTNSTVGTITAIDGKGYIPGCMDNTYLNYNPLATYSDSSCINDQGTIGIDIDNPLGHTVEETYFYGKSNRGIVNGYSEYYSYTYPPNSVNVLNQGNYGTTTSNAYFGEGTNNYGYVGGQISTENNTNNYGYVDGEAYGNFHNYGTVNGYSELYGGHNEIGGLINGDAYFESDGYNAGTINGNVNFSGANNNQTGTINGDVWFYSEGYHNYGTINGNAYFEGNGNEYENYNEGTVNGDALFLNYSDNRGTVTGIATYIHGCSDTAASNYTEYYQNDGYCEYIGNNTDNPVGHTVVGPITFTNGTSNYGTVIGDAIFEDGSFNYGTTTGDATFNGYYQSQANGTGDQTGNAMVINGTFDYRGTGVVGGDMYDLYGSKLTYFEFFDPNYPNMYITQGYNIQLYANNYGTTIGNTIFGGNFVNYGTTTGTTTFNNGSYNEGYVGGDAYMYTGHYGDQPSGGVFALVNDLRGTIAGTVRGIDSAAITQYIFQSSAVNYSNINGNVTFNTSSHNEGNITGDMVLKTDYYGSVPTTSELFFDGTDWNGSVSGNVYATDSTTLITDYKFYYGNNNGTINGDVLFLSSSLNNGTINGNVVFDENGSGQNQGVINGDVAFNNKFFQLGTVNGTATLTGIAQTIYGFSNITNFVKHALSRDTLYIEPGSTLNISGLATLLGADANNLLTIRSTAANTNANLNINGTLNADFLRLKNISNSGLSQDVSNKTIFNDGGNTGFTFRSNSTPSSRGGVTSTYTPPTLPPSRGGVVPTPPTSPTTPTPPRQSSPSAGGTIDSFFAKTIAPLLFKGITNFDVLTSDGKSAGSTYIPNPLKDLNVKSVLNLNKLPSNFLNNLSKFLFNTSENNFTNYAPLTKYFLSKGVDINKPSDVVKLGTQPIRIGAKDEIDIAGIYDLNVASTITYDKKTGDVIQLVKTQPNKNLNISLFGDKKITGTYSGQSVTFTPNGNLQTLNITTSTKPGTYTLKTSGSPLSLIIEVIQPIESNSVVEEVKGGVVNWIKGLFKN